MSIFIIPPSKDVILRELKLRAKTSGDNLEAINNRMKEYETEMNHKDDYDYVVVNQEFEICVNEIERIINKSRNKLLIN